MIMAEMARRQRTQTEGEAMIMAEMARRQRTQTEGELIWKKLIILGIYYCPDRINIQF
jgi:hypothetical protein